MNAPEKLNTHGGKREGSGRKTRDPQIKKRMPTFRMQNWFLDYLQQFDDPATELMNGYCRGKGKTKDQLIEELESK